MILDDLTRVMQRLAYRQESLEAALVDAPSHRRGELSRTQGRLQRLLEPWRVLEDNLRRAQGARELLSDPDMGPLAQEELRELEAAQAVLIEQSLDAIARETPDAEKPAIVEVRAGTGGEEAALFAGDLWRMYQLHAQKRRWQFEIISSTPSEHGGLKDGTFILRGSGAYGLMRFESGGHRVQRVPETEAQGRVHTSAATVAVLPEATEVDIEIRQDDLIVERKRSGGAGGQHVNKTESAIRLTHTPTGIVVSCQDERSQGANLDKAMKVMRSRVLEHRKNLIDATRAADRKTQVGSGDRSERIRTYNFPQNRITDHRINWTGYNLDRYVQGNIEELQEAMLQNARLDALHALDEEEQT